MKDFLEKLPEIKGGNDRYVIPDSSIGAERDADGIYHLGVSESVRIAVPNEAFSNRYNYTLSLKGDVDIPYHLRTEDGYPVWYRKIGNSLSEKNGERVLSFGEFNLAHERSAYTILRGDFDKGIEYHFSVNAEFSGIDKIGDVLVSLEIYYGEPKTRAYHEKADKTVYLAIENTVGVKNYSADFYLRDKVDFMMLKICAKGFSGAGYLTAPSLTSGTVEYSRPFVDDGELEDFSWVGEGFSLVQYPTFDITLNGTQVFHGKKFDRLNSFSGVEFKLPREAILPRDNEIVITLSDESVRPYRFKSVSLLSDPYEFEILSHPDTCIKGKSFPVLVYMPSAGEVSANLPEGVVMTSPAKLRAGYGVLKFRADDFIGSFDISLSACGAERTLRVERITEKSDDGVKTGSGDAVYIGNDIDAFIRYFVWYTSENIGKMITFRHVYRWGGASEFDSSYWAYVTDLLKQYGIYYVNMVDGRDINGLNAGPTVESMQSEYFLGDQTHENDGSYTYWYQRINSLQEEIFYHVLSRKMEKVGIYGKMSPVYTKTGEPRMFYAEDSAADMKEAYENFQRGIDATHINGSPRHTGVTPMFDAFYKAGFDFVGAETTYNSNEILLGALRGTSRQREKRYTGSHLAIQWSTVPLTTLGHLKRYLLSLYICYINGVTDINTEEGLWVMENNYADFDRYSDCCANHTRVQKQFARFVDTHTRRGKQVVSGAMVMGKYDGMNLFSASQVYGQAGEEWAHSTPERSWEILKKVFYPDAKLDMIYAYCSKGGRECVTEQDLKFISVSKDYFFCDEQNLGDVSVTPYGQIDLIPYDSPRLSDYKYLFFTGWSTADKALVQSLSKFVLAGGKLVIAKPHLYTSVKRSEVLSGNGALIKCDELYPLIGVRYDENGKFLSARAQKLSDILYKNKLGRGEVYYFDTDKYPIEYADEYSAVIAGIAAEYNQGALSGLDRISYSLYKTFKNRIYYLLNIDWWSGEPAAATYTFLGRDYRISPSELELMIITEGDALSVACAEPYSEVISVEGGNIVLQGSGECRFTVFSGSPISSITMDGAELGFTVLENGAYSVSALLGGKHTVTVA